MPKSRDSLEFEHRSIEFIPEDERHGRLSGMFTIWFAANTQVTTIVTGAFAILLGLPMLWAITALVIGNVVGAVFMAAHSAQGPKLGIPQMIQSRAQFGYYGAILPLAIVMAMYVGFFAASTVLAGDALTAWTGMSVSTGIGIGAACSAVIAIYGYDLVHRYMRWMSIISGLAFLFLWFRLITTHNVGAVSHGGPLNFGPFLLTVALAATWQITYAPYVADYSRYLPKATPIRVAFWLTYSGSVLGAVWMMIFGCFAAALAKAFDVNPVSFIVHLSPGAYPVFFLIVLLGLVGSNVTNLYGMFMAGTTTFTAILKYRVTRRTRAEWVIVVAIVGALIAIIGSGHFFTNFENLILFLSYFVIPWTAINLVDFYAIRHGQYNIEAIFQPGGEYGRVGWRAVSAYVVAIVVEVPFINSSFYVGPIVSHLGGGDISWIVGVIVAGGLYYSMMRSRRTGESATDRAQVVHREAEQLEG